MKKLATICSVVLVLALMVSFTASCGGTPVETTVTATVTDTATKTVPVTTTETATVTTTQTTTATTTATVATTVTITPTATLSFATSTYTNDTYKFSFQYDKVWTATWNTTYNVVSFGDATYYDPSIRIFRFPKATGATLADVLKSSAIMTDINTASPVGSPVISETQENFRNIYGTTVTRIVHQYTSGTPSTSYCISYGFLKDDYWFVMLCTQDSGWGITKLDPKKPDEMFSTWQFK